MNKFTSLMAADVLKRKHSIPSLSIVGSSGAGKTTAITNILNPEIASYIFIGIGEKSQTTTFATNFILDERIDQQNSFAISIKPKDLDNKLIAGKIFKAISNQFLENDYDVEDTLKSLEEDGWKDVFLEPKDASYHLGLIEDKLDIEELIVLIKELLKNVNIEDFEDKASERKKTLGKKASIRKIKREMLLDYVLDPKITKWVGSIENIIIKELEEIMGLQDFFNESFSYTVDGSGGDVLEKIYNPQKPYSLVIDSIDMSCRPRDEVIDIMKNKNSDIPLRMILIDTVGVTQEGMDENSVTIGIDRALNRSVDGIVLIINLEEREDVIKDILDGLNNKLEKSQNNSDIYILFSKGDKLVETKIDKRKKKNLKINQESYDTEIKSVLEEVSETIEVLANEISSNIKDKRWQSLSYKHEDIDPRIKAIHSNKSFSTEEKKEKIKHFVPEGLFEFIINAVYDQQGKILPKGIQPILVTVNDIEESPLRVTVSQSKLSKRLDNIVNNLTKDKSTLGQYKGIPSTNVMYHHASVTAYYNKLIYGMGHTTRTTVYDHFSVNMKGLISNNLKKFGLTMEEILNEYAIDICADNLSDKEVYNIIKRLENRDYFQSSEKERKILENNYLEMIGSNLHLIEGKIINQVSIKASYKNEYIKSQIDSIYFDPLITYTETFKRIQSKYREIFGSDEFKKILCDEIGIAVSEIVNDGFIVI